LLQGINSEGETSGNSPTKTSLMHLKPLYIEEKIQEVSLIFENFPQVTIYYSFWDKIREFLEI
jgi:hypothetical protein